jgi:hypothetical protein
LAVEQEEMVLEDMEAQVVEVVPPVLGLKLTILTVMIIMEIDILTHISGLIQTQEEWMALMALEEETDMLK